MWMAADQLAGNGRNHVPEIEGLQLLRYAGMEHDLEKKVAKFVPQVGKIAALDRVDDLVGFLQRVRCDRLEGLRQVPRTAAVRCPQRSHEVEKVLNVVRGSHKGDPLGRQQAIAASSADRHRVCAASGRIIRSECQSPIDKSLVLPVRDVTSAVSNASCLSSFENLLGAARLSPSGVLSRAAADPSLGRVTFQTGRGVTFLSGVYSDMSVPD